MKIKHDRAKSARFKFEKGNNLIEKKLKELNLKIKLHQISDYAEQIYEINQIKILENKFKDEELSEINDKIHKYMLNNYDLEQAIKAKFILRDKYEKQQKEISEYCNNLRTKSSNNEKVFEEYINSINDIKLQNNNAQRDYDKIIEDLSNENLILNKKINERIEVYNSQRQKLIESKNKQEILEKELNHIQSYLNNRRKVHKEKYDKLKNEYEVMKKRFAELNLKYSNVKNPQFISHNIINKNNKKNPNELYEKKLFTKRIMKETDSNNLILLNRIDELFKKYNKELSVTTEFSTRKGTISSPKSKKNHKYTKSFY